MNVRREPLLLGLTALVVAWLAWGLFSESQNPLKKPQWSNAGLPVPDPRIPDLAAIPSPPRPDASAARRDLFGEPRDTRPLAKLELHAEPPNPELQLPTPDPYPWLLPPPVPAPAIRDWHRFLRVPAQPETADDAAPANAAAPNGGAAPVAANGGGAAAPAEAAASPSAAPAAAANQDDLLAKRYDRLTPKDGPPMWGRVKNPNKFDLKDDEAIVFQVIDPKTGKPFGAPLTYTRDRLISFELARTIRNEMEKRKRKVAQIGGNEVAIREFGLWCLEQGIEEPAALDEAERQLRKAVELAPNDPTNQLALGRCFEGTFRFEEAWKLYRSMTEGALKANAEAWVARAQLERKLHLTRDAEEHLRKAVTLDGTSFHARLALGEFLLARGDAAGARAEIEVALKNEPSGVTGASDRARARRRAGEAALQCNDLPAAAEAFERAKAADASDADALTGRAVVAWLQGKPADALKLLDAALAGSPSASALVTRGTIRASQRDFAGAKRDFESAVGLDPLRDSRPLAGLGFVALATGHADDAGSALDRALSNDPDDPYASYLQGRVQRDRGELDLASASLKRAAMADLGFVDALTELGILNTQREPPLSDTAERYFAKAFELDPKNAEVAALRGMNLLLSGQGRRARECFVAGMGADHENALARLGAALCDYLDDNSLAAKQGLRALDDARPEGDAFRAYALDLLGAIEIHESKEEWNDAFDRQALREGWDVDPAADVKVSIVDGEVRIQGAYQDGGDVRVRRGDRGTENEIIRAVDFRVFEADVLVPADNQTDVTVFVRKLESRQGVSNITFELSLVKDRKGTVAVRYRLNDTTPKDEIVTNVPWPAGERVHVRIEQSDDTEAPKGRVYLNGEQVGAEHPFPRGSSGNFLVGIGAKGDSGRQALLSFDNVRIVRRRPR